MHWCGIVPRMNGRLQQRSLNCIVAEHNLRDVTNKVESVAQMSSQLITSTVYHNIIIFLQNTSICDQWFLKFFSLVRTDI